MIYYFLSNSDNGRLSTFYFNFESKRGCFFSSFCWICNGHSHPVNIIEMLLDNPTKNRVVVLGHTHSSVFPTSFHPCRPRPWESSLWLRTANKARAITVRQYVCGSLIWNESHQITSRQTHQTNHAKSLIWNHSHQTSNQSHQSITPNHSHHEWFYMWIIWCEKTDLSVWEMMFSSQTRNCGTKKNGFLHAFKKVSKKHNNGNCLRWKS